jgi:hypothetical protein
MSKSKKERKLSILLNEYNLTNEKIEQFLKAQVGYFISGNFIIFGILGLFGNSKELLGFSTIILYLIPLTILTYFGTIMYHYQRTLALQGYKQYLERKINEIAGEKLIFYGELGMKYLEKENRFVVFNILSFGVLFLISIFIAILATIYNLEEISNTLILSVIGLTLILLGIFVWAIFKVKKTPSTILNVSIKTNLE